MREEPRCPASLPSSALDPGQPPVVMIPAQILTGSSGGEEIDLRTLWAVLAGGKRFIGSLAAGLAVLAWVGSFLVSPRFRAEVVFQPLESLSGASLSAALNQSGLAGALGFAPPGRPNLIDQLAGVLESRTLAREVLKHHPELKTVLDAAVVRQGSGSPIDEDDYAMALAGEVAVIRSTRGPPRLVIELPDAEMAARIANAYMVALQEYINQNTFSSAKKSRVYVEEQVEKFRQELTRAEEELRDFQEDSKLISVGSQIEGDLRIVSDFKSRLMTKEMEKEVLLKVSTPQNPQIKSLEDEIAALRQKLQRLEAGAGNFVVGGDLGLVSHEGRLVTGSLASAPQVMLDYYRLARNVDTAQKVYVLLVQQLASARIAEQNEAATFVVIDPAIVPRTMSQPKRALMAMAGAMVGLFAGVVLALFRGLAAGPIPDLARAKPGT